MTSFASSTTLRLAKALSSMTAVALVGPRVMKRLRENSGPISAATAEP